MGEPAVMERVGEKLTSQQMARMTAGQGQWTAQGDHWRHVQEGKPDVLRYRRPGIAAIARMFDDHDGPAFY